MKLAIMQPYFFPYLGYFQLINAVDKFVIYDDITFIKQGWINRNYILLNGDKHLFTIPLKNISSNALIHETKVAPKPFNWQHKLLQTFQQAYQKAPFFKDVFPLLEIIIAGSTGKSIADIARKSIISVLNYLDIKTVIIASSAVYKNDSLKNTSRVIDICQKEAACVYLNAAGGFGLYNKEEFSSHGIQLKFIQSALQPYNQFQNNFISSLSIIDVLMFNSADRVREMLNDYKLV
ncbi:MAG: WbqC family protein [Ginsengibacter sp.]